MKSHRFAFFGIALLAFLAPSAYAHDRATVGISIGIGGPGYSIYYSDPAYVYYPPPPPPVVYYEPAPVYYAPPGYYVVPAPRVVYGERWHHRKHKHRHRDYDD